MLVSCPLRRSADGPLLYATAVREKPHHAVAVDAHGNVMTGGTRLTRTTPDPGPWGPADPPVADTTAPTLRGATLPCA